MRILSTTRLYTYRWLLAPLAHAVLAAAAYAGAFLLRFDFTIPHSELSRFLATVPLLVIIRCVALQRFGLFRDSWRHVSLRDVLNVTWAVLLGSAVFVAALAALGQLPGISRAVLVTDALLAIFFTAGARAARRLTRERITRPTGTRCFIIGAGEAGEQLLRQIQHDDRGQYAVVGLIDDDPDTHGRSLHGVPVRGSTTDLKDLAQAYRIQELVIAIPSATSAQLRRVADRCAETGLNFKILPPLHAMLSGRAELAQLRDVQLEDLLGRQPVRLDLEPMARSFKDKIVLITGGAGSIGSELARQIARFGPRRLVLLDRAENTLQYTLAELVRHHPELDVVPVLASVTNRARLVQAFRAYRPNYVFHAAACKHVNLCEANAIEAAWNNVVGTLRAAECAARFSVDRFVLISTDKAVNPSSVMGVTKRIAERVVLELPYLAASTTEFRVVRFGNVLGSDGSVLPLFRRQLAMGGPLTVTHPDATRYFMTIPEAVQLLLQAATLPEAAGHIAMLEMGEQMRILDLAEQLVRLSGLSPYQDVSIEFVGLRPGEKLHEELFSHRERTSGTSVDKIRRVEPSAAPAADFRRELMQLMTHLRAGDDHALLRDLANLVPEYTPSGAVAAAPVTDSVDAGAWSTHSMEVPA